MKEFDEQISPPVRFEGPSKWWLLVDSGSGGFVCDGVSGIAAEDNTREPRLQSGVYKTEEVHVDEVGNG